MWLTVKVKSRRYVIIDTPMKTCNIVCLYLCTFCILISVYIQFWFLINRLIVPILLFIKMLILCLDKLEYVPTPNKAFDMPSILCLFIDFKCLKDCCSDYVCFPKMHTMLCDRICMILNWINTLNLEFSRQHICQKFWK